MQRCFKLLCALTRSSQYYCDLLLCTTEAITGCLQGARNERMTVLIRYALVYICLINFHYADACIPNFYGSVQLKIHFVDGKDAHSRLKLVKLPCTPTVDDILEKYRHYRLEKDGLMADSTREMIKGLRSFFDKALPIMLLYKSERQQYEDTMAVMVAPSTIYGAEHLLRLFVKLPELLVHAKIEEETSTKLQQILLDFLEYELFIILD
ncbi:hypothetical protein Pint_08708 [Pistacia integerrima]|uniref:Uncharacterized protein n=1 Tax=Pistacia integerrima TaxID=434235 RepID=A0ACC0XZX7_9ROSI|nr:hypothetical protein Pint_08708 [Pistacia integerrima]